MNPSLSLLPQARDPRAFYLLDLSSWSRGIYEGARAKGVQVDDPGNDVVPRGVVPRLIRDVLVARQPSFLGIAGDVVGDKGGRHMLWPGYKAKRTPPGPGYMREAIEKVRAEHAAKSAPAKSATKSRPRKEPELQLGLKLG